MGHLPPVQGGTILRQLLSGVLPLHANAGLVFDRYLPIWNGELAQPDKSKRYDRDLQVFVDGFNRTRSQAAGALHEHHERLDRLTPRAHNRSYKTQYRLVLGLGAEHPLENGFLFDHILGVPFIPGSSLKGMLRAYLTWQGRMDERDRLLGTLAEPPARSGTQQGELVFLPAYPKSWPKLAVDIVNCHHPDYYADRHSGNRDAKPVEWENPNPVFFLAVERGVEFVFRLTTVARVPNDAREATVAQAHTLLAEALGTLGVGAKTAVGYGVMETSPTARRPAQRGRT